MKCFLLGLFLVLHAAQCVYAGNHPPVPSVSKELQRMQTLVGRWEGTKTDAGTPSEKVSVEYKLTAGGSAVVETLFAGTPHEMVSVYHDRNGALSMTHYCMLGNQPSMKLIKETAGAFEFDYVDTSGINSRVDPHMHALNISFLDEGHITHNWKFHEKGKEVGITTLTLARR